MGGIHNDFVRRHDGKGRSTTERTCPTLAGDDAWKLMFRPACHCHGGCARCPGGTPVARSGEVQGATEITEKDTTTESGITSLQFLTLSFDLRPSSVSSVPL